MGKNGAANLACDHRYRDTVVTCDRKNASDVFGTFPTCPKRPMPMISTPRLSYTNVYSPYLYAYPKDPKDPNTPYVGMYTIGTSGDTTRTYQMFGGTTKGAKRLAACTTELIPPASPGSLPEEAKWQRLQADNCANSYILNDAIYPFNKERPRLLSYEDPANPGKLISMKDQCQPLLTFRDTTNEYPAEVYIETAWRKTLIDPTYRKTSTVFKGIPCQLSNLFSVAGLPRVGCEYEPHLPNGVTIKPGTETPLPLIGGVFPEVKLSAISSAPYEQIVDPTHPFSPRWDFLITDREYSKPSPSWADVPQAGVIWGLHSIYMSDTTDTVFCAGVKSAPSESGQQKLDSEVNVDVLEFRRGPLEDALLRRVTYNAICYEHQALWTSDTFIGIVIPLSYCWAITRVSIDPPYVFGQDHACWQCFGLSGQVDDESQHPPCTTNYLGKDLKMKDPQRPAAGGFNNFSLQAQCNYFMQGRNAKYDMKTVCRNLRKPYTQLNKLKMRYHNPEDPNDPNGDNVVLKANEGLGSDGAVEGMRFREYFGNHMPYPRLWDIGASLQKDYVVNANDQPPTDTTGQYSTVVGVGREASPAVASNPAPADADGLKPADKYTDQRCKTAGWSNIHVNISGINTYAPPMVSFAGTSVTLPDPMTSWTELKLYQTNTMRTVGMSCLGRYEKVFKPGSAENLILMATGAEWSRLNIQECTRKPDGTTKNCTNMSLKDYIAAGKPADTSATVYMKEFLPSLWPNSWRGYIATGGLDPTNENRFPNFSGPGWANLMANLALIPSLDLAEPGDIILMPFGPSNNPLSPGLSKLALVIETRLPNATDCDNQKNCYIKVLEPDNGKFPDICGTTDTWGEMKARYYYKPGHLPPQAQSFYTAAPPDGLGWTTSCEDTKLAHCEAPDWSTMVLYRIRNDVRKGCQNKDHAYDCFKDQ